MNSNEDETKMNKLQQHDQQQLSEVDWLIGIDEAGRGCLAGPVTAGVCDFLFK